MIPSGAVSTRPITLGEQYAAQSASLSQEKPTLYGPNNQRLTAEDFTTLYGPGVPLMPRIRQPIEPRAWQYPISYNLIPVPRGEERTQLSFDHLRYFAGASYYVAIALRYRVQRMIGAKWSFAPADDASDLRARKAHADEIKSLTAWWKNPNRVDRVSFSTWLGQSVREALITDALCYYRMPTRAGDLHSLVQIDGAKIKLLIDAQAHVVGYQQILFGIPQSQWPVYGATQNEAGEWEANGQDWIDYIVLNPQVNGAYGLSPMEEIRPLIDISILRTKHQLAWYDEGTTPAGFIQELGENWSKKNVDDFQEKLDNEFAGNFKRRSSMLAIPGKYNPAKAHEFNKDEEEAIISAVCAHFGVPRSLFVSKVSRASAEVESDNTEDVGHKPLCLAFAEFINRVSRERLGMSDDVEFSFIDERSGDELKKASALKVYVDADILSPDEVRAREFGLEPKEPNVKPLGILPNGAPAIGPDGKPVSNPGVRAGASGASGAPPTGGSNAGGSPSSEAGKPGDDKAAKTEVATWRKFALKRVERGRQTDTFEARALPAEVAALITEGLAKAADRDAVLHVFDEALFALAGLEKRGPQLSAKVRKEAEQKIAAALKRNFEDEKARLRALYAERRGAAA